ncbi:Disease resistance protein [Cinnamomum micranthum f. kanehirae]|uniref:Disease resistance protein n=1 Tax=Cinnamomum micranthum f. kanehirae TaxID=337451 RepID=A0A3S3P6P5_9MAGN|nr:Disease resistance protein [Cinnamomum micranthum f. kanehirae]
MASAVVTSVSAKLGNLLFQEAKNLYGVNDDVEWIQTQLTRMQCFLKDADSRQNKEERVKNWVKEIIQVSYDAEDIIETFIYSQNAQRRRRGFAEWIARCVCIVGELVRELITQYMVSKKIKKIRQKINDISESRKTFGIRDINEGRQEESSSTSSPQEHWQFYSDVKEEDVVGQKNEISTLREQLISEEPSRCLISIVGMPGSGKTTLAKKVYHVVKDGFPCHAFVTLSQQYKIKNILMDVLKCVMGLRREEMEKLTEKELGEKLRDHFKKERYLVVIDDIWSKEGWDDMLDPILPDVKNKSRVILTTRDEKVIPDDPTLRMRLLDDDEGWELFMKKIFPKEKNPSRACPANLEEIGKKILAKCGGLPLAILVSGGLLVREPHTAKVWLDVLESVDRHYLTESTNKCGRILDSGYWQLPYYLKPCFLYMGLFPERHTISSNKLIGLWIAEGFIENKGSAKLEDVAEEYLEELVGRSMIQVVRRKSNGSVGQCRIHDLLRDLCISEARQNNFFTIHNDKGTTSSSTNVRRLALHCNVDVYDNENRSTATLRSILHTHLVDFEKLRNTRGKLLRVLDAGGRHISRNEFPKEVSKFVLLRYLELGRYANESLPSSIGNLSNLETLRLWGSGTVPNEICNSEHLRHLYTHGFDIDGHPRVNNLRNLQTLCLRAGTWINDGLGQLTSLRKLVIDGDLSSYHKALSKSIDKLCKLRSLKLLSGCSIPPFMPFTHHLHLYKMILEGRMMKPPEIPRSLVMLTLVGSSLKQDDISALKKLTNVVVIPTLRFRAFKRRKLKIFVGDISVTCDNLWFGIKLVSFLFFFILLLLYNLFLKYHVKIVRRVILEIGLYC